MNCTALLSRTFFFCVILHTYHATPRLKENNIFLWELRFKSQKIYKTSWSVDVNTYCPCGKQDDVKQYKRKNIGILTVLLILKYLYREKSTMLTIFFNGNRHLSLEAKQKGLQGYIELYSRVLELTKFHSNSIRFFFIKLIPTFAITFR